MLINQGNPGQPRFYIPFLTEIHRRFPEFHVIAGDFLRLFMIIPS